MNRPGPSRCLLGRTYSFEEWHFGATRSQCSRDLLRDEPRLHRLMLRRRGRDRKSDPCVPAGGAVLVAELAVALEVDVALHVPDREQEADLRTDPEDARLEIAERRARAAVAGELLVGVADETHVNLLR